MDGTAEWTFEGGPEPTDFESQWNSQNHSYFLVGTDGFRNRYMCGVYDGIRKVDYF